MLFGDRPSPSHVPVNPTIIDDDDDDVARVNTGTEQRRDGNQKLRAHAVNNVILVMHAQPKSTEETTR